MNEYELNAFHSEFDPKAMADSLKADPSPKNKVKNFAVLKTSYFLTFVNDKGSPVVINSSDGKRLVAVFTSRDELERWPFDRAEIREIPYEAAKQAAMNNPRLDGMVVNPFGGGMRLLRAQLNDIDNTMRFAARGDHATLRLTATRDYPIGLPLAVSELMEQHPEVYRVWLLASRTGTEHLDTKLMVVDFDGKPDELFPHILNAIRLYLRDGEAIQMLKADLKLLQAAEATANPIYTKKQ